MFRAVTLLVLVALTLFAQGCQAVATPEGAFRSYIAAVRTADTERLLALDAGLWERTKSLFASDREDFAGQLREKLALPAASASIENGFEQPACDYPARAFFPAGAEVSVLDQVVENEDQVKLQVRVEYPEDVAPVYVEAVDVVWNEPTTYRGGLHIPRIKPIPMFYPGIFEHGHPFLVRPRYQGRHETFDLNLRSRSVRLLMLTVSMVRDEKTGNWIVRAIQPDFSRSES